MSRTLHVIDQVGETAQAVVLRLSVDAARFETHGNTDQHAWLLFGGEATRHAARAIGLRDEQFRLLPKPTGLHRLLPPALATPKRLMTQAHRVVCWTEGATQIASLLGCAHVVRRVDDATLCPFAKRIITQAHGEAGASQASGRQALRKRWGVEPGATVIALLGDRFDEVDVGAAMMTMVLMHDALCPLQPDRAAVRLLCHPLAKRRGEAAVFSELRGVEALFVQDAQVAMPWSVLAGCDVAIAPVPSEAGLSTLWASEMGVPVVTPSDRRLPMLESLEHLIISRSSEPKDLADALTNWSRAQASQATLC